MKYHIDDKSVSLADLKQRIEDTDLVPSRVSLLEGINEIFQSLEQAGIKTLAELRNELKTKKRLEQLSVTSDVDMEYLTLLRREIEGYFPCIIPTITRCLDTVPGREDRGHTRMPLPTAQGTMVLLFSTSALRIFMMSSSVNSSNPEWCIPTTISSNSSYSL